MMDVAIIPLNCVDVQEFRIESMIISYYLPMEKDDEKYEKQVYNDISIEI